MSIIVMFIIIPDYRMTILLVIVCIVILMSYNHVIVITVGITVVIVNYLDQNHSVPPAILISVSSPRIDSVYYSYYWYELRDSHE